MSEAAKQSSTTRGAAENLRGAKSNFPGSEHVAIASEAKESK
jgi:hypothetical protein